MNWEIIRSVIERSLRRLRVKRSPNGPSWNCEPLQSCHTPCLVTTASVEGQPGLLDCPADPLGRALLACISRISLTGRQVPLDEPPFREHDISRSLYLGDKVSIVRSSRSGSCDPS